MRAALRVGVTGGVGSGKTTVTSFFKELGYPVIDFDEISKSLTQGKDAFAVQQIRETFGQNVFDDRNFLSRDLLRERVFNSVKDRICLENILHPLIRKEVELEYRAKSSLSSLVIFDIPLLAESLMWQEEMDKILVVDCDEEVQLQRVVARSNWKKEQVQAVIDSQVSRAQRLSIATDVILNNDATSLQELKAQVKKLAEKWQACMC